MNHIALRNHRIFPVTGLSRLPATSPRQWGGGENSFGGERDEYGTSRMVRGLAILDHQANQFTLSNLVGELVLCENLLWTVARMIDKPTSEFPTMASILKLRSAEIAVAMADWALQVHGAAGYCREFRAERLLRDARLGPIGEGSRETLSALIGRHLARSSH